MVEGKETQNTEVEFISFLSGGFTIATIVNPLHTDTWVYKKSKHELLSVPCDAKIGSH